jgi:hypothetical protein
VGLSRGHFYFAQRGHYYFAATEDISTLPKGDITTLLRHLNCNKLREPTTDFY